MLLNIFLGGESIASMTVALRRIQAAMNDQFIKKNYEIKKRA